MKSFILGKESKFERMKIMNTLDYEAVKQHIDILNVAYHLCLEIAEEKGFETKCICPFCRI